MIAFGDHRIEDHLWEKVILPEACWIWVGVSSDNHGCGRYGYLKRANPQGKKIITMIHRYFYEKLVGPIPDGLSIDHKCRNTLCVNPEHLEPVTHRENVMRGVSFAAKYARRTHCFKGHLLHERAVTKPGVYGRYCVECNKQRCKETYLRNRPASVTPRIFKNSDRGEA